MKNWILFVALVSSVGCASHRFAVPDQDMPISMIKADLQKELPGGVRHTSENGREYLSQYFVPGDELALIPKGNMEESRAHVKMEIFGDRRPYSIYVTVPVDKKVGADTEGENAYKRDGYDPVLAEVIALRLKRRLAERQTKQNLFDDFRAF